MKRKEKNFLILIKKQSQVIVMIFTLMYLIIKVIAIIISGLKKSFFSINFFYKKCLLDLKTHYICTCLRQAGALRAISSVGSEHLVYTERVGGSNPSLPTSLKNPYNCADFFVF